MLMLPALMSSLPSMSLNSLTPPPAIGREGQSSRSHLRLVLIASADASLRERLRHSLTGLRWQVLEASGGAAASWEASQAQQLEALVVDAWLPDLEVHEFLKDFHRDYPHVDLMMTDGVAAEQSARSPYRQELLYALRRSQEVDTAAWNTAGSFENDARQPALDELPPLAAPRMPVPSSAPRNPLAAGSPAWTGNGSGDRLGDRASDRTEDRAEDRARQLLGTSSRSSLPGLYPADPGSEQAGSRQGHGAETGLDFMINAIKPSEAVPQADSMSHPALADQFETGLAADIAARGDLIGFDRLTQSSPVQDFEQRPIGRADSKTAGSAALARALEHPVSRRSTVAIERIPELIGTSPVMLEVSRRIRLVAARTTPVLIEGPTGSGKEVVAEALHRLSKRSRKPFVAINCAAIPEALLEAELFGHTRGAFTGAVQGRVGRIEAADGGTLFLDEIGEMPLALQSKLLRFFESGELQRIGDNETIRVDVRIIAATHQPLAENAQKGSFRADLYYRLAVFLIHTPALAEHMNDLPQFVAYFLERMGRTSPVKRIDSSAMFRLSTHGWPGNVRELQHVLERAAILAGEEAVITDAEIDFGLSLMN